ncbi:MAG: hypothetical protein KBT01_08000 [Clostridiales bacterium]|nr:hypothetical protein [Candidatus Blautia equi]
MSEVKKVKTSDDITFQEAGITFPKGMIFMIESVEPEGIILYTDLGERFMIDFETFENGFEIAL